MRVALSVFIMAYVGLSLSFVAALRLHGENATGMAALLSLAIVVKLSDVGAYVIGRALGRHRMTPVLSPGKTIEGALGGVATACLASWLAFEYLFPWMFPASFARGKPPGGRAWSTAAWWRPRESWGTFLNRS